MDNRRGEYGRTYEAALAVEESVSQMRTFGRKFVEVRLEAFLGCPIGRLQHAIRS
jgi:hypothetical protein